MGAPAKCQEQWDERPHAVHLQAHLREVCRTHHALSIPAVMFIQVHYVNALPMEAVVLHFRLASSYPNLSHTWTVLCLDCKEILLASHQPYFPFVFLKWCISFTSTTNRLTTRRPTKQQEVTLLNRERIFPGQSYTDFWEFHISYFCFHSRVHTSGRTLQLKKQY